MAVPQNPRLNALSREKRGFERFSRDSTKTARGRPGDTGHRKETLRLFQDTPANGISKSSIADFGGSLCIFRDFVLELAS
jgi:hypothetical protein